MKETTDKGKMVTLSKQICDEILSCDMPKTSFRAKVSTLLEEALNNRRLPKEQLERELQAHREAITRLEEELKTIK